MKVRVTVFVLVLGGLAATALFFWGRGEDTPRKQPPPPPPPVKAPRDVPQVAAAYDFLYRQMDQFHQTVTVYDDRDSGAAHFFPSGWGGDLETLTREQAREIIDDACTTKPYRGATCIKITYPRKLAEEGARGWVSISWQFPDGNWGKHKGHDLSRYCFPGEPVWLVFAARGQNGGEYAEFKVGGINRPPKDNPPLPQRDSFGPEGVRVRLTRDWKEYQIDLSGRDLSNVIGGFTWATSTAYNETGCTIFLDEIRFEFGPKGTAARLAEPRFIRSYVPQGDVSPLAVASALGLMGSPLGAGPFLAPPAYLAARAPDRHFRNVCYCYDNALALLALVARGTAEDLRRARLLADAFVYAQSRDRHFKDGRLRNAYACGNLADAAGGSARLPGWWDDAAQCWLEDGYFASSDCGNLGWTMLALLSFWEKTKEGADSKYLRAVERLGEWVHKHGHNATPPGGYSGGLEGWEVTKTNPKGQQPVTWKSTEHGIDLFVAFKRLESATGNAVWGPRAEHARAFVEGAMWNAQAGHFWTGTKPDGRTINPDPIPLDIHPWALLGFRDRVRYGPAIDWAVKNCRVLRCPVDPKARGFDFNTDRDGVWWEGTAQMQVAFRFLDRQKEAAECLADLRSAAQCGEPNKGAIFASSRDGLTTGFSREWGNWVYYRRPHLGATCWYIFAELGWNPYWAEPVTTTLP